MSQGMGHSLSLSLSLSHSSQVDAALTRRLERDNSVLAIAPNTLPEAEVTMAYLDLLIRYGRGGGAVPLTCPAKKRK